MSSNVLRDTPDAVVNPHSDRDNRSGIRKDIYFPTSLHSRLESYRHEHKVLLGANSAHLDRRKLAPMSFTQVVLEACEAFLKERDS